MSKRDKLNSITAGLTDVLANIQRPPVDVPPRTAPAQLLAFRGEMEAYEDKIEVLEARIKDLESTAIPVAAIAPNPWQPRTFFDEDDIRKLAESIAEVGLIQPIVVRKILSHGGTVSCDGAITGGVSHRGTVGSGGDDEGEVSHRGTVGGEDAAEKEVSHGGTVGNGGVTDGEVSHRGTTQVTYELVAGERRWRAHRLLGMADIKAIVIEAANDDMAVMALVENIDRQDLSDFEVSKAIRRAEQEFPSRSRMAEALGMGRNELYRYLAFSSLPEFVTRDLENSPRLVSRRTAEEIQRTIAKHGDLAVQSLRSFWSRVTSGDLDATKLSELIPAALLRGEAVRTDRDIKKLFVGKEQAGSITRDAGALTVKIRAAVLTPEKEAEIRSLIERVLVS